MTLFVPHVRCFLFVALFAAASAVSLPAQTQPPPAPPAATPQRPTFTSDTSTTVPGTIELEFGAMGGHQFGGPWTLPTTLKYTPDVRHRLLREGEFSVSFNAADSLGLPAGRRTRFGDTVTLAFRKPVYRRPRFSLALAPQASLFLRGSDGSRLGGTVLVAWATGPNSLVGNVTWTAATSPTPANPAHLVELAADYARSVGESGLASRFSVFAGVLAQQPSTGDTAVSLGQGIAFRLRPNLVLDLAVRQHGLAAGPARYELLAGFTVNFGRLRLF